MSDANARRFTETPYNELQIPRDMTEPCDGFTIRGKRKCLSDITALLSHVETERNKIPLWVLFIAVQFLDYIWATLVLLGIEKLRVIKGFTAGSMLDSYFHPYSHSLIMAVLWSVVAALIYKTICSRWRGFATTISLRL